MLSAVRESPGCVSGELGEVDSVSEVVETAYEVIVSVGAADEPVAAEVPVVAVVVEVPGGPGPAVGVVARSYFLDRAANPLVLGDGSIAVHGRRVLRVSVASSILGTGPHAHPRNELRDASTAVDAPPALFSGAAPAPLVAPRVESRRTQRSSVLGRVRRPMLCVRRTPTSHIRGSSTAGAFCDDGAQWRRSIALQWFESAGGCSRSARAVPAGGEPLGVDGHGPPAQVLRIA